MAYQWRRWGYDPVVEEAARRRAAVVAVPRWGGMQAGRQGQVVRPVSAYDEAVEDLGGRSWTQWQRAAAGEIGAKADWQRAMNTPASAPGWRVPEMQRAARQQVGEARDWAQQQIEAARGLARQAGEYGARTMGRAVSDVEAAGRRGGGGGYVPAPRGVPAGWYKAFQEEHGVTPEEYYARVGEGMNEALADKEWAEGFAQDAGRAPTTQEWENWYYHSRRGGRPGPPPGTQEYTALRAQQKAARRKRRNAWLERQRKEREAAEAAARASWRPKIVPQPVTWRVGAR